MINVVNQVVYAGGMKNVDISIIDGEVIMEDGRLKTIDESEVFEKIQGISEAIIRKSGLPLVRRWKHIR